MHAKASASDGSTLANVAFRSAKVRAARPIRMARPKAISDGREAQT